MLRILSALAVSIILLEAPIVSFAAQPPTKKTSSNLPKSPEPFGLILGATTFGELKSIISKEGAKNEGAGYGEAKPSYGDNDPDGVANERIILVDVSGLPLDNLEMARFGFFDDKLYLIKYTFRKNADFNKIYKQLEAKYGAGKSTGGFSDKGYEWAFSGGVFMNLKEEFFGDHKLIFIHNPLSSKVKQSNQQVYDEHIKKKASAPRGL